ncbi:MAG: threonine/serine exporter family protein [Clostridiales bacterium]|nr:threonine/serine exporter family protein [Clostridiales bacterium]
MYTKENRSIENILKITLETASLLLRNGADVRRVEDTMIRICKAYNLKDPEVFSIASFIIITASTKDGKTLTQTKRIYSSSMNLTILEKANALSREICENPEPPSYVLEKISDIEKNSSNSNKKICFGYMLAAGSLSIFFGGNLKDAFSSVIITLILFFGNKYILKPNLNRILYTFIISALMGIMAIIFSIIGIGTHADKIIIGDIMLLIPGMSLINSITDMFCGDFVTGTTQVVAALLTTLSIAGGFLFSLAVIGGLF